MPEDVTDVQVVPDRDDPFERLTVIGMLVERFALLEATLRRTAWLLLSTDTVVAHILTVHASARDLIELSGMIIKESSRKGIDRATPELLQALGAASACL